MYPKEPSSNLMILSYLVNLADKRYKGRNKKDDRESNMRITKGTEISAIYNMRKAIRDFKAAWKDFKKAEKYIESKRQHELFYPPDRLPGRNRMR